MKRSISVDNNAINVMTHFKWGICRLMDIGENNKAADLIVDFFDTFFPVFQEDVNINDSLVNDSEGVSKKSPYVCEYVDVEYIFTNMVDNVIDFVKKGDRHRHKLSLSMWLSKKLLNSKYPGIKKDYNQAINTYSVYYLDVIGKEVANWAAWKISKIPNQ